MPRKKPPAKVNAVIDFETDPFLYGRVPKPFVAGFYDGEIYREFWGDDCVLQLMQFLDDSPKAYRIYAHNGGKFDFFFLLDDLENPLKIINGRIVKAKSGKHEFRDSYAIIPLPLSAYQKDEIDYRLFEREAREQNRAAISKYLRGDCEYLLRLVSAFWERFGDRLTIGTTAIKKLQEFHPFDSQFESHDKTFRPFYFGGRVEAFETGILKGDWHVYDVNSMYPYVMAEYDHPTGNEYAMAYNGIMDKKGNISTVGAYPMFFAEIECQQQGAFPVRMKDRPLNFNVPEGIFQVTSHELKAAVKAGRVQNVKVLKVWAPEKVIRFKEYVSVYMAEKIAAKKAGDKVGEIFAKLLLNSAYGKFGQSPDNYKDFYIQHPGDDQPEEPYELYSTHPGGVILWQKESPSKRYFDVATAASVTGAARSVLLGALSSRGRIAYCDTDSVISDGPLRGLQIDSATLGAWKLEATGDLLAIGGKKLYALRRGKDAIKSASKGVRLSDAQIFDIARGKTVQWHNDAPTFSLGNQPRFVHRKIQSRNG
jgi:hypothetical protein